MYQKNEHVFKKMSFITPKALRVLYFLALDPINQFHEREVVRQTGVSVGAVNQILKGFHKHGLVDREKRGRMHFYRINMENPVVRQFKVLFNVFSLTELIEEIKQRCTRIVLFGSCSEGTDVKDSDMDLFVLASDIASVKRHINLYERKLGRKVSAIVVDPNGLAKIRKEDKPLYERISRGITLWEQK